MPILSSGESAEVGSARDPLRASARWVQAVGTVTLDGPPAVVGGGRVELVHDGPITDIDGAAFPEPWNPAELSKEIQTRVPCVVPWTEAQRKQIEDPDRGDVVWYGG